MIEQKCHCGKKYMAREADIKRGWGKSYSKACAAKKRTRREQSGNYRIASASAKYQKRLDNKSFDDADPSWDAQKFQG